MTAGRGTTGLSTAAILEAQVCFIRPAGHFGPLSAPVVACDERP
ncbi:hypothetical protein [uncultured Planktomarina sp.]